MSDQQRPPTALLVAGLVVLALGLGGCGFGCFRGVGVVKSVQNAISSSTAKHFGESLTFRAVGGTAVVMTTTDGLCSAATPDGRPVRLAPPPKGTTGSFSNGGNSYDFAYSIATSPGSRYVVTCNGNDASGGFTVVALPRGGGVVATGTSLGLGALLVLVGAGLTVGGVVARGRWKRRHAPTIVPPSAAAAGFGAVPPPQYPVAPPPPVAPQAPPSSTGMPPGYPSGPPVVPDPPAPPSPPGGQVPRG